MQGKFKCSSFTGILAAILISMLMVRCAVSFADKLNSLLAFGGVFTLIGIVIGALLMTASRMPCSFSADDITVTVKKLCLKKTIRYGDLTDVLVEHEYIEPISPRLSPYYREMIVFRTKSGDITYWRKMDIDLSVTAADPDSLKRQLDDGDFVKLRNYILARKA